MSDEQRMVTEFHRTFDIVIGPSPSIPDEATCALRVNLMQEEFDELREALAQRDVEAVAKELADLLYVVYGTAVSCGLDGPRVPGGAPLQYEQSGRIQACRWQMAQAS